MAELTVDITYGSALFQAAKETDKIDVLSEEAAEVQKIFEMEPLFFKALTFPEISAEEKMSMVDNVFGSKISEEMINFLKVLIRNGRMMAFGRIIRMFEKLKSEEEGIEQGMVYSVEPLDEERIRILEEETSDLMGGVVKLKNEIDKSLIGGILIQLDGKIIDASLRKRLQDISSAIHS